VAVLIPIDCKDLPSRLYVVATVAVA